ncbi:hypothetical protein BK139_05850 [Paenibacillus sp. FSL R5-0490]|nr:hypothetical protein BK139_05850 [Paenibacillus sp. FSL R5-0490]
MQTLGSFSNSYVLMSSGKWELSGRVEIEVIRKFTEANNKKSAKSGDVYGKLSFICYIIIFYSMLFMPVRKEHI